MHGNAEIQPDEKLGALKLVLESDEFRNSPRLSDFLSYVVKEEIEGRQARLKALSIAMEVYRRDIDFDPQSNALVRVEAGRLRKALAIFYARVKSGVSVEIIVPKGSYVPRYRRLSGTGAPRITEVRGDGESAEPRRGAEQEASATFRPRPTSMMPGPRIPLSFSTEGLIDPARAAARLSNHTAAASLRAPSGYLTRRTEGFHSVGEMGESRSMSLEEENAKLKRLLADAILDNTVLKDLLSKKW